MIDNRTVGRTIATLRQAKGMTQQQLAAAMNVSHQAVSKWENGAALPDIQTMVGLTQLFGITVEQLLGGQIPEARLQEEDFSDREELYEYAQDTDDDEGVDETVDADESACGQECGGESDGTRANIDFKELLDMAPFMSKSAVSEMLEKFGRKLTPMEIARIAPFVEASCLERLIRESESEITWDSLRRVAPFLKKEAVDAFARTIALGEKYVKPVSGEVNRVAGDVWKAVDDVSRRIEKGVDKAIRKVVRFGENAVNEVAKAFDDLTSEAVTREERLARLRRSAFERAMDDGRWDWIAEHIDEVQDEELRRKISEAANRQNMREWVFEHLGGYADPETIDQAIINGEWDWLGEHVERFDALNQRLVVKAAMQAENWEWLNQHADQLELDDMAAEIAAASRRAEERDLAVRLTKAFLNDEQVKAIAMEAAADGDAEFIRLIGCELDRGVLCEVCVVMAKAQRWDEIYDLSDALGVDGLETLMETAIDMGDFDAVDHLDALLKDRITEDEQE